MKKVIFRRFFLALVLCLVVCGGISGAMMTHSFLKNTQTQMANSLKVIAHEMDFQGDLQKQAEEFNEIAMSDMTRFTLLSSDGTVLADSEKISKQDHKERKEIQEALNSGTGSSRRKSETTGKNTLYVAYHPQDSGYVLRLAMPFGSYAQSSSVVFVSLGISVVAALLMALLLAGRVSQSISKPLSEIAQELKKVRRKDWSVAFKEYKYDELNEIVESIEQLTRRIEKTIRKLHLERNKIHFVLDNMQEGIVFLDEEQNVLTINRSAREFLNAPQNPRGNNIVHYTIRSRVLRGVASALEEGNVSSFDLTTPDNRIIAAYVSRVQEGVINEHKLGAVILLIDVTSDRQAQKMRQEFFSNASHELKTPTTAIQGYAELMEQGMAKDPETEKKYISVIKKEAENMGNLISDILMISSLESGENTMKPENIPLAPLVKEVFSANQPTADALHLALNLECTVESYYSDPKQMRELFNNLISNSVKYNVDGGQVNVSIRKTEDFLVVSVEDTGIGIPLESQQRVFERFYRVDKGRSRKMGGTGLGLAIVKHIVQFHQGRLHLQSQVGEGTKITVELPL